MTGYRDTCGQGANVVCVDPGIELAFGDDGVLWNPTEAQVECMERDGVRRDRFVRVEAPETEPPKVEAEPVPAPATEEASELAASVAAEEPSGEVRGVVEGGGRRRRRTYSPGGDDD